MTATGYALAASMVVWAAIGLYVFWMSRKSAELDRRVEQLELLHDRQAGGE